LNIFQKLLSHQINIYFNISLNKKSVFRKQSENVGYLFFSHEVLNNLMASRQH